MSDRRLYRNGRVASASANLERTDVLVTGDRIEAVSPGLKVPGEVVEVDCEGKILLPALQDVHTHAASYGEESLAAIARAAARGGFAGVVLMPDGEPCIDEGSQVSTLKEKAARCPVEVEVAGCVTKDRAGKGLAGIAGMKEAGAVFLTDGDAAVENPRLLRRAMEYARNFDLFIASHCDTPALSAGGAMNEGVVSYQLGLPGYPALSEEVAMERDLRLARYVGARIHLRSVSTRGAIEMIQRAKEQGLSVTAEVCLHHLIFNERDIGDYDTNFKVNPPLRTEADCEHLLEGVRKGIIDLMATDHTPKSIYAKKTDFESAPAGMSWLDSALVAAYHYLVKPGKLEWRHLVAAFSEKPRAFLGKPSLRIEPGGSASFVVFDPDGSSRLDPDVIGPNHQNTPFLRREVDGAILETVHQGRVIWKR